MPVFAKGAINAGYHVSGLGYVDGYSIVGEIMNKVYHKQVLIEFDVWEPQEQLVQKELDSIVINIKKTLAHGANIHIKSTDEKN